MRHNWNPIARNTPFNWKTEKPFWNPLYWLYTESVPADSKKLRDGYARLRKQLHFLKPKEYDAVFDTVTELCTESEQIAFYAGVRLGAALMMELNGGNPT